MHYLHKTSLLVYAKIHVCNIIAMKRIFVLALMTVAHIHAAPSFADQSKNKYLKAACTSVLENLLLNPQSLEVNSVSYYSSSNGVGLGKFFIDYSALGKSGVVVEERAFCELTDRATVSIKSGARRDYSHLK